MTILIVDDDSDDVQLFCEAVAYLNQSEFVSAKKEVITCLTAANGLKALEVLNALSNVPDYIFLDINMPLMDGEECLKAIKTNPKFLDVSVIMLSTAFRTNQPSELKNLGAFECIIKPNGFNELVKILARYVYRSY